MRLVFPSVAIALSLVGLFATANATEEVATPYQGVTLEETPAKDEGPTAKHEGPTAKDEGPTTANPAAARTQGVAWLVEHQRADGGWGAGSHGRDNLQAPSDVATTAYVTLALLRDGQGIAKHRDAIHQSVDFVVKAIETAPEGPRLNTPEGTQPQHKLGQLVDTHFAAMLLGEVQSRINDPDLRRRVSVAYDKVLGKVQQSQQADGSFDANGWAPILSSSIAAQSLSTAKMNGKDIDEQVIARSDAYQAQLDGGSGGSFDASAGAGVELYAVAGSMRSNDLSAKEKQRTGDEADADAMAEAEESRQAAVTRVDGDASGRLVAGFGSIGGEEMLSYQMIADTLAENGGEEWTKWSDKMGQHLVGIQNGDGSWSGHHCITSTVFVTAGAVMTLSAGDWAQVKAEG